MSPPTLCCGVLQTHGRGKGRLTPPPPIYLQPVSTPDKSCVLSSPPLDYFFPTFYYEYFQVRRRIERILWLKTQNLLPTTNTLFST